MDLTQLPLEIRRLLAKYAEESPEILAALANRGTGMTEAAATVGTSLLGSIPAGLSGLGTMMKTGDMDQASDAVTSVLGGLTYQPRTSAGQEYLEGLGNFFTKAEHAIDRTPEAFARSGLTLEQQRAAEPALKEMPGMSELALKYLGPAGAAAGYTALNVADPSWLPNAAWTVPAIALGKSKPLMGSVFRSALEEAVSSGQPLATGQQWLGYLQNRPGVKKLEIRDRGLDKFLTENAGRAVRREELAEFLQGPGGLQIYPRYYAKDGAEPPIPGLEHFGSQDKVSTIFRATDDPMDAPIPIAEGVEEILLDKMSGNTYTLRKTESGKYQLQLDLMQGQDILADPEIWQDFTGLTVGDLQRIEETQGVFDPVELVTEWDKLPSDAKVKVAVKEHREKLRQGLIEASGQKLVPEGPPEYGEYVLGMHRRTRGLEPTPENYRMVLYQVPSEADVRIGKAGLTPEELAEYQALSVKGLAPEELDVIDWDNAYDQMKYGDYNQLGRLSLKPKKTAQEEAAYQALAAQAPKKPNLWTGDFSELRRRKALTPQERVRLYELWARQAEPGWGTASLGDYTGGHWSSNYVENVMAHARVVDRTMPDGSLWLHIEELQSDPHQKAFELRKNEAKRIMREEKIPYKEALKRVPETYGYQTLEQAERLSRLDRQESLIKAEYESMPIPERIARGRELMPDGIAYHAKLPSVIDREFVEQTLREGTQYYDAYPPETTDIASAVDEIMSRQRPVIDTIMERFPEDDWTTMARELVGEPESGFPTGSWDLLELDPRMKALREERSGATGGIPGVDLPPSSPGAVRDMPFKSNWHEMILQHLGQYAAERGYDGIMVTKGLDQVDRWQTELRQRIDHIEYGRLKNGSLRVKIFGKGGSEVFSGEIPKGEYVFGKASTDEALGEPLAELVGSGAAEQIEATAPRWDEETAKLAGAEALEDPRAQSFSRYYYETDANGDTHLFGNRMDDPEGPPDYFGTIPQGGDFDTRLEGPENIQEFVDLYHPRSPTPLFNQVAPQEFLNGNILSRLGELMDEGRPTGRAAARRQSEQSRVKWDGTAKLEDPLEPFQRLEGDTLTIGGAGMTVFYDMKVPQTLNSMGKRHGSQVYEERFSYPEKKIQQEIADVQDRVDTFRADVAKLQPLADDPGYPERWNAITDRIDALTDEASVIQDRLWYSETHNTADDVALRALKGQIYILKEERAQMGPSPRVLTRELEDAKDELAQALEEIEEIKKKSAGVPVWAWKIGPKLRDELKQPRRAYREGGHVEEDEEPGLIATEMLPDDLAGWIGPIKQQAKALGQGFAQLPYLAAGTPVDLATEVMRPFGYKAEKPVGGSQWLIDRARQYGLLPAASLDAPGAETLGSLLASTVDPATGAAKLAGAAQAVLPILAARPIVGRLGHREPLYSALGEAVRTRIPDSGPSQQILGTIQNTPGVTKAELEDTGILSRFSSPVVRKQDLRDDLEMGMPRLERRVMDYDQIDPNGHGFESGTTARRLVAYQYPDHPEDYTAPHFTQNGGEASQNLVAHALVGDRKAGDRKYLHVEELQSDLHQSARDFGYADDPRAEAKFNEVFLEWEESMPLTAELEADLRDQVRQLTQDPAIMADLKAPGGWETEPNWFANVNSRVKGEAVAAALKRQGRVEEADQLLALTKEFDLAQNEEWRLYDRIAGPEEGGFPPRYPMAKNWDEVALKDLVKLALQYGYDGITINQSPVLTRRWGPDTEKGMRLYYDQRAPQALNRLGRKYGAQVVPDAYDSNTPVWKLDFNDPFRTLKDQQLPQYFQGGSVRATSGRPALAR